MEVLIGRLESATGPDRKLDSDVELFAFPQRSFPTPHYTASIDAALTLVPKGYHVRLSGEDDGWGCSLLPNGLKECLGLAPTPALALCIAALKARYDANASSE